jgi:hypothetical protein
LWSTSIVYKRDWQYNNVNLYSCDRSAGGPG